MRGPRSWSVRKSDVPSALFDVAHKSSLQEEVPADPVLHLSSCGAAALRPDEDAESWLVKEVGEYGI